jgi:hypothetical protein
MCVSNIRLLLEIEAKRAFFENQSIDLISLMILLLQMVDFCLVYMSFLFHYPIRTIIILLSLQGTNKNLSLSVFILLLRSNLA